ncbi:MAG: NUDIX hydrolase [Candidatus Nanopelagicales bacterium]
MAPPIRAAGVVLLRHRQGDTKVLLVHRPRHRDWSLPKGKLDKDEHVVAAAVRECDEETGVVPVLGPALRRQEYPVMGRPKIVDYWRAEAGRDNGFSRNAEVDEIRWATQAQAKNLLTYRRDYELVREALELPLTVPLIFLRHTQAMKRADYRGKNDSGRPVSSRGRSQARALVPLLAAFGISRIHSSDAARCIQTVRPFATAARLSVKKEPLVSEEGFDDKPKAAVARVLTLADLQVPLVICSHRPVLPHILAPFADAAGKKLQSMFSDPLAPGGFIVVHRTFSKGHWRIGAVERHEL